MGMRDTYLKLNSKVLNELDVYYLDTQLLICRLTLCNLGIYL